MNIVLAFDSFKGSMTAHEAVQAARAGVLAAHPDANITCLPMADGGEGTTDALCRWRDCKKVRCNVHDPLMRTIEAEYGIDTNGKTAIMEMAAAAGLMLIEATGRNPLETTTCGVGEMVLDAIARGCTHILIGIGGSATNDGGMGMLDAMGTRFLDDKGMRLKPVGKNLTRISRIDWSGLACLEGISIDVICDVTNPLFGPDGAAYMFAPQKGANSQEVEELDNGLRHLASLMPGNPFTPGSGAAGGLGYGLLSLGSCLRRGIDVMLDAAGIDLHLQHADLVMTGEGKIDRQTLCGKLPRGVLSRAKKHGTPAIVLAGAVEDREMLLDAGFEDVISINPPDMKSEEYMQRDVAIQNMTNAATAIIGNRFTTLQSRQQNAFPAIQNSKKEKNL